MIRVEISNNLGVVGPLPDDILGIIRRECSFEVQGAEHSEAYKRGHWDGKKQLTTKSRSAGLLEFPMGLWERISYILDSNKVSYEIDDYRTNAKQYLDIEMADFVEKRDYQVEAVESAIKARRSVIQVATGGGKTVIASLLMAELKCNTVFLVHTKDLLYQAKQSFEEFMIGTPIGQIGDGVIDIQPITVATMQTISRALGVKYEKYEFDEDNYMDTTDISKRKKDITKMLDDADLVIWDEVHRIACDMAFGVSNAIPNAPYRVGLSASPWRDDGADMMIEASMGHTSYQVSASDLIDMGYLVKPIIRMIPVPARVNHNEDTRKYDTIYKEEIVDNDHRNRLIYKYATQFMSMGISTLILVQQIKHGNRLKKMITDNFDPIEFISGRDFSQKRNMAIQEMREGERLSLIASTIADEGLDIKRLAVVILAGGGKSSTRALQRVGRVLRPFPDKTHAIVIDFADEAKYLRKHVARRRQMYETEPNFDILDL